MGAKIPNGRLAVLGRTLKPVSGRAVATRFILFTVPIGTALHKDIVLLLMLSGRDLIL